jgi:hypothetical protein
MTTKLLYELADQSLSLLPRPPVERDVERLGPFGRQLRRRRGFGLVLRQKSLLFGDECVQPRLEIV